MESTESPHTLAITTQKSLNHQTPHYNAPHIRTWSSGHDKLSTPNTTTPSRRPLFTARFPIPFPFFQHHHPHITTIIPPLSPIITNHHLFTQPCPQGSQCSDQEKVTTPKPWPMGDGLKIYKCTPPPQQLPPINTTTSAASFIPCLAPDTRNTTTNNKALLAL